ncbi:MAG: hypothetical protein HC825_01170 [Oscillatoriales cyanobacterium RM1_1_9]|nr:hypothetical protein [Oscillatoriales cyanobacterium RM2_1_1]NJO70692.1 hypothetical protein [Oscillatoriales cyanobacterium RM1_1_9]
MPILRVDMTLGLRKGRQVLGRLSHQKGGITPHFFKKNERSRWNVAGIAENLNWTAIVYPVSLISYPLRNYVESV